MSVALRGGGHLQRDGSSDIGEEHGRVQIGEFSDKGRRQGRVCDMAGLGFVKKSGRSRHPHYPAQLCLGHASQVGDVFGRDAAVEPNIR